MPTFAAKVYLNEARDHFFGFNEFAPAELNLASVFDLDAADHNAALNVIFRELNVDSPSEPWAKDYRQRRNRSLSVGDVAVLGESAWACASAGWDKISGDELRAAVVE